MRWFLVFTGIPTLVLYGGIFGFFLAWVCSTMWGLDRAEPHVAIAAMQAMNASVRNAVFFPFFFLPPLAGFVVAIAYYLRGLRMPAVWLACGAVIYLFGGLILTMAVHVPMNERLAIIPIPTDAAAAARVWTEYSEAWKFWNVTRTVLSLIALCLTALGLGAAAWQCALRR